MNDEQGASKRPMDEVFERIARQVAQSVTRAIDESGLRETVESLVRRLRKEGDPPATEPGAGPAAGATEQQRPPQEPAKPKPICSVEGCNLPVRAKGLCARHYNRVRYAEKKKDRPEPQIRGVGQCSVEGCTETVHAKGLCGKHFMEWVRSLRQET